jgi:hypothetical protein
MQTQTCIWHLPTLLEKESARRRAKQQEKSTTPRADPLSRRIPLLLLVQMSWPTSTWPAEVILSVAVALLALVAPAVSRAASLLKPLRRRDPYSGVCRKRYFLVCMCDA